MEETERLRSLERAHFNVLNLTPRDLELDLFSDVPEEPAPIDGDGAVGLEQAARGIFGDRLFVFTTKGRSAERALARGLALQGAVVTNRLFRTTELAFKSAGLTVENAPEQDRTSDVDAAWLEQRLERGGVAAVCLEVSNNQRFGWPLSLKNVEAARALCDRRGAKLILDATRLMANSAALGGDILEGARRMLDLADAFTISCAKEYFTTAGGLIGVSDRGLRRRVFEAAFEEGTMLDPGSKALLARGLLHMATDAEAIMRERRRRLELLAARMRESSLQMIEPAGAHALFVLVDDGVMDGDPLRARALEALLYQRTGIRIRVTPHPIGRTVVRVTWPLGRYSDAELVRAADGLRDLFDGAADAPRLRVREGEAPIHFLDHYERIDESRRSS